MEYTFYFESKVRIKSPNKNEEPQSPNKNKEPLGPMYLKFHTNDGTEFILSEEWRVACRKKQKIPLQRLILLKRNNHDYLYRVTVEVSSIINQTSGKIVLSRITKPLRTSIIILLSDFRHLRYSIPNKVLFQGVEICQRVTSDTFKYKVSIIRLHTQQFEKPFERDKLLMFSDQLLSLLNTRDFSDIIITDGYSNIHAHRNILAARSSYFRSMFQNNWSENQAKTVVIRGTDMEVIKEMLHYIYSGVIRSMEFSVMYDLFEAAEKFLLEDLKMSLSKEIQKQLNPENAVGVYVLGHFAFDEDLRNSSLKIINTKSDAFRTEFWRCIRDDEEYKEIFKAIRTEKAK